MKKSVEKRSVKKFLSSKDCVLFISKGSLLSVECGRKNGENIFPLIFSIKNKRHNQENIKKGSVKSSLKKVEAAQIGP